MMYMHYCSGCQFIHMLNGHKIFCPRCGFKLTELRITYMDYVNLSGEDRKKLAVRCANPAELTKLGTTYQMFKYSKWYRLLQSTSPAEVRKLNSDKHVAVG